MNDITIKLQEEGKKGKAYVGDVLDPQAEMTYSKAGDKLLIIDHTEVGDSLRGKGVGRKLLDAIVQMAREHEIRILPLCPFAKSVFDKDESIRDVLK